MAGPLKSIIQKHNGIMEDDVTGRMIKPLTKMGPFRPHSKKNNNKQ